MLTQKLLNKCHLKGDFLLSDGKTHATEYYDLSPVFMSYFGLRLLCNMINQKLENIAYEHVACYELCPVPLVGAYCHSNINVTGLIVRKKNKGHGTDRVIEGQYKVGDKVVLLEDVTATGQSVMRAIEILQGNGLRVAGVLTIINRQEGCDQLLWNHNFMWLYTKSELEEFEKRG